MYTKRKLFCYNVPFCASSPVLSSCHHRENPQVPSSSDSASYRTGEEKKITSEYTRNPARKIPP